MIKIRLAKSEEKSLIAELERKLDLEIPSLRPDETWVIEEKGELVGLARITDLGPAYFLSSVGLLPEKRGRGLARQLLQAVLKKRDKDVYLYTIIPEFFFHFGFQKVDPPAFLPSRSILDCQGCRPNQCLCLVRRKP